MVFGNLHFLRPWWLLALIPLTVILVRLWRYSHAEQHWQAVCEPQLLPYLLIDVQDKLHRYCIALLGCAWFCAVMALSGPSWTQLPQAIYQAQRAQVLVLDVSANMAAEDIKPNRLARARYKVLDILHQSKEQQTGLIVFTGKPFVVSPLTQDAETIAAMVPALTSDIMPVAGSNIGAALRQAAALVKQAGINQGHIILITASQPTLLDNSVAKQLQQQGLQLSILGIGTAVGAPVPNMTADEDTKLAKLDIAGLTRLAAAGDGDYIAFTDTDADIKALLAMQPASSAEAKRTGQSITVWQDQGYWWLLPVLVIAALVFRRGWFERITQ